MSEDRPIYVIDTNILVDYVDVIPGEEGMRPDEPTIDLSEAHLVIPTVVVRELSNFKGENSDRGKAARVVLRRLRDLFENKISSIDEVYKLQAPVEVENSKQLFSILPVHKDFWKCLPFHPSDRDMDGQIILTTLAASLAAGSFKIDGDLDADDLDDAKFDNVTLLTNDNGLAIRARERGLKTSRYGYKYPALYTGRRDIVVPNEFFNEFYNSPDGFVERAVFEKYLPKEPRLVANEFIVMTLEDPTSPPANYNPHRDRFFSNIGRYDAEYDAILKLRYVDDFPTEVSNPGQAIYAEALMDPGISAIVCTGPAGSGKTYMATIFGYEASKAGQFIGVTAVPCENRNELGALPGDLDEKMDPDVQPLKKCFAQLLAA